jgi:phage-related protein
MSDRVDISATIKVNDQASAAIGAVRSSVQGLANMAKSAGQSVARLGTTANFGAALKGVGTSLRGLGGAVMSIVKPIAALAGIGGGIGMAEAVAGMQSYVDSTKELTRTAPIVGTTVERLSELQYAASRVGISGEELTGALTRANAAIGKAAVGKGTQLTSLFRKLGISLRDANGNLRSSPDVLMQFANAIQKQTDPVTKLRMATELFGRAAGPEMLKLLSQGQAGIAEFIRQGQEMGVIIGDEKAKEALDFAKAQAQVRQVWQSLSVTLSQNLLPVLKPLIEQFRDLLAENKEAIVKAVTSAFEALATAIKGIDLEKTIKDIKEWWTWVDQLVTSTVGWEAVLGVLALSMTGLLGPLTAVTLAIGKLAIALVGLAVANPMITAIVVGVAAIAAGAYLLWKHWDKVSAWFAELWQEVRQAFDDVVEWLGPWGNLFVPVLIYKHWEAISQFFADLWNDPQKKFWEVIDWLNDFVMQFIPQPVIDAWQAVSGFFKSLWDDVTKIFDDAWALIKPIVDAIKNAISWITDNMPSLSGIGQKLGNVGSAIFNAPGRALDYVTGRGGKQPGQTIVQQATAQQATAKLDGAVDVNIHMAGAPAGTTVETAQRGQVRATGDVGRSMAYP